MPPKKTTKKQDAEKIAELERQLQMTRQANENLKKAAIEKERQAHSLLKIAKPEGQAGRRSGYRLEMAMGIESDHFLRILRLVRVYASIYLDIRMSISEQGKTKLQLAKAKIASHIPVFQCYKGLWPLHEMLRQYLGTHKISFGKDKKAEENETATPDRKAIQVYLHGLKSQRPRGSQLDEVEDDNDDDEGEEEEEEEELSDEDEDEEDYAKTKPPSKKTVLKNKKYPQALPRAKTVKFSQATSSVKSIPSQVKAGASNMEKATKKTPRKVTLVLPAVPKKKSANDEPAEISGGSDEEEFESPAPKHSKKGNIKTPVPDEPADISGGSDNEDFESPRPKELKKKVKTQATPKAPKKKASMAGKTTQKKEKRKVNDEAENEPPHKRQRKQVHDEPMEVSGDIDSDDDFEPLKLKQPKKGNVKTPAPSKVPKKTASMPAAGKMKAKTTQKKEKRRINEDAENEPPPKRQRKQKQTGSSTLHIEKVVSSQAFDHAKIPSKCPAPMCEDKVPQSPTPYLMGLYERYHKHAELTRQGKKAGGRVHLVGELCMAIANYWVDDRDGPTTASDNGWPLEIDFESLPDRIVKLNAEITGVIANEFVLEDSAAWKTFIENLKGAGLNLRAFREVSDWDRFRAVGSNAHAGYYGPMGVMIINSTLGRMFNHGSGAFQEIGSTLATLTSLKTKDVSHSDFMFWKSADASSVSPKDFLDFIVLPFVATLLISQDLKVGEKEAEETRITSKQYGLKFNSNTDDGRMDDITMKNMMLGLKERGECVIPGKFRRKPELAPNACAGPGPSTMAQTATRRRNAAVAA